MSVILVDLVDRGHDLQINSWNWRPMLALLRARGLIGEEQFERMGASGCGGRLTAEESKRAALFFREEIIPRLKDGEQMHADGSVSTTPSKPRLISSTSTRDLHVVRKACLQSFIVFCDTGQGFKVG
jgi:hypothetical protein